MALGKLNIFRRFDERIASELRRQKKTIAKGLVCVLLTSVLTAATIPLTERAIRAIQNATPTRQGVLDPIPGERELAEVAGLPRELVRERVGPLMNPELSLPSPEELSRVLGAPPSQIEAALSRISGEDVANETRAERNRRQDAALMELVFLCLGVIVIYGIKYFLTRGQTMYLSRAAARLASDLRLRLFAKLQRLPVSYFNQKRSGAIQSVLTNDVGVYQGAVNLIRDSVDGPVKATLALVTIFIIQWQLALVAVLFIPVMAWFIDRNGKKMKKAQADVQDDLADIAGMSNEALGGARVIKAFSAEERIGGVYGALVERQFGSQMRAVRRFAQLRPMVELIGAVSLALILVICGFMARQGQLMISQIVALTFALDVINQGARALANVNNTYNQVQAAADRIYREVLDVPEEEAAADGGKVLENPVGRIAFEDVRFAYPDGTEALLGVSFVIEPGASLALVGPSGAGKSTIADLMLRFYDPTHGRITFDGVDYRELNRTWLRSQFGVVPQQTFLFAGTIEDNLRLGADHATDQEIRDAAVAANALAFIERTDLGMKTELGERGARLSGGEGQRLAIARALVRDPKVLLLDEATSNLDAHSEKVVTEALEAAMASRTTLFIAHRLTTAARATSIVMLRHGEIMEQGSHDDLMAAGGAYAAMYRAFTSGLVTEV